MCLFTCVAVRAIHQQIVTDLSAEEFLLALRRFIARRGKPQQIVLDNEPQFKLAKSSVDVAWENAVRDPDVQSHIAEQRITWSFIVQLSPWMGGFYERLVGISKMALRKAIGKTCLTMLQLQTFLTETELAPSHFLSSNTKSGTHLNINADNIADLLNLRERSQTNLKSPRAEAKEIPSKGDIVQMKANIPRGS